MPRSRALFSRSRDRADQLGPLHGALIPEWRNNLFVASHYGQHIARLVLDGERVAGEERLLLDQRQMV